MKNIALVLPYDYKLMMAASILDVFETVNAIRAKDAPFRISVVSNENTNFQNYKLRSTRSRVKYDLVLIPSFTTRDIATTLRKNSVYIKWLKDQFDSGCDMASFCTGAYLFAEAGLLNGRLATTHVDHCAGFIVRYPRSFVKPGRTLTVDGPCFTSGGSTSAFHLLVFLVQKYCGNETAVRISKIFAIELDRHQQSYFSTFRPDYSHNDLLVKKVQRRIESNFGSIQTIDEITRDLPTSRRNIVRRFKQVTGVPPIEYLQNIRIETAKKKLEQTDLSISEIISETGYADPKSFRKVFTKLVGIKPLEYREKFKVR
ncbi:MAG TPA: helix-turn-helix domain-containing protein [Cyclobacteriaceae bacterium]|nr:helix-turn-helix domain-containing protein [Cyclobacteriaceae bacterium]